MNVYFAILGLLGGIFAAASSGSDSSASASEAPSSDMPMPSGEGDAPMPPGDHDGHDGGDHDGPHTPPPSSGEYVDITSFGMFHHSSSHTMDDSLEGGRTPITTEALEAYNGVRAFFGLDPVDLEAIGSWAFDNDMTNNDVAYGQDTLGVGLYYGMQGAKAGWITDEAYDPQLLADIQKTARLGTEEDVMEMVQANGHPGLAEHLEQSGLVETFINTLKMEPHYGGWMHGRTHGDLEFSDESGATVATAHDLNHLTVLSHDQSQPFMNDTFDYPQWPALDAPAEDVIDYFQSMVTLGDPRGEGISSSTQAASAPVMNEMDAESLMALLATDTIEDTQAHQMEDVIDEMEML